MADDAPDRLSQISTMWTQLARSQEPDADPDRRALAALVERYHPAAYGYLLARTGRDDVAADLFQEFAVKFLRGDFRRADPSRGRFRDYLRATLANLARKHAGRAAREPRPGGDELGDVAAPADDPADAADEVFLAAWRKALLDRAWEALRDGELAGGTPYHTALRLRADLPDAPSGELARRLTDRLNSDQPFTDAGVRKLLQRGRQAFVEHLLDETARSVPTTDPDRLEEELIALGFHGYCKGAIPGWAARR